MAGLQSGGQLLAPLEQETALSWAGFVLLTLEAVGLPLHAEARPPGPRRKGATVPQTAYGNLHVLHLSSWVPSEPV